MHEKQKKALSPKKKERIQYVSIDSIDIELQAKLERQAWHVPGYGVRLSHAQSMVII